jgi:hypothetical protein
MPVYYNSFGSSTKGKKRKFKSAEEKRSYEEAIKSEFGLAQKRKPVYTSGSSTLIESRPYIRQTPKIPSRGNGIGVATKSEDKVYTGSKMIGIGTLHKSNAVPVFTDDEAKEMASMRR